MSDDATPRLGLPYLAAAQAQKHVTVNEGLGLLDALVQTAVESRSLAAQPPAPADGALYILPASPTGGRLERPAGGNGDALRSRSLAGASTVTGLDRLRQGHPRDRGVLQGRLG